MIRKPEKRCVYASAEVEKNHNKEEQSKGRKSKERNKNEFENVLNRKQNRYLSGVCVCKSIK